MSQQTWRCSWLPWGEVKKQKARRYAPIAGACTPVHANARQAISNGGNVRGSARKQKIQCVRPACGCRAVGRCTQMHFPSERLSARWRPALQEDARTRTERSEAERAYSIGVACAADVSAEAGACVVPASSVGSEGAGGLIMGETAAGRSTGTAALYAWPLSSSAS